MNLQKPGTFVTGYTNYYNCIKFESSHIKNGPNNAKKVQIINHIPFVPCQLAIPFLSYDFFKIWPWKSKVKVIAQGLKVHITLYRLLSLLFHIISSPIPMIQLFQNLTLTIKGHDMGPTFSQLKGQVHGWGQSSKSQCGSSILLTHS